MEPQDDEQISVKPAMHLALKNIICKLEKIKSNISKLVAAVNWRPPKEYFMRRIPAVDTTRATAGANE